MRCFTQKVSEAFKASELISSLNFITTLLNILPPHLPLEQKFYIATPLLLEQKSFNPSASNLIQFLST